MDSEKDDGAEVSSESASKTFYNTNYPELPPSTVDTNLENTSSDEEVKEIEATVVPNLESVQNPKVNIVTEISEVKAGTSSGTTDSDRTAVSTPDVVHNEDIVKIQQSPNIPDESMAFDGLTRRQLLTLAVLAMSDFMAAIILTNHNPWFPIQAKAYEISIGLVGTVFGAFELSCFLFLPLLQGKMHQCCVSPQTLFHLGVFTTASATLLFAFLGCIENWPYFLGFAIVIRFIEGIGQAAFIAASFAIIALEFPSAVSSAFVSLETFFGLGLIIGPALGGALWDALPHPQRFTLLFGLLGAIAFLVGVAGLLFLPQGRGDHVHELERYGYTKGYRVFALLKVKSIPLVGFAVVSTAVSIGYLYVTLSPLLSQFGLHPVLFGGIFLLNGGTAALTAPLFARLIEITHRSKLMMIFGSVMIFIGFCLIGPAPFITLETTAWLVAIGLFIQGLGIGSLCASTFKLMLYKAVQSGYADNIKTYWLVSSLWTLLFCLGTLIGTISSGFLYDGVGFRSGSWLVLDLQILVILFTLVSLLSVGIMKYQSSPKSSSYAPIDTESEPLLGTSRKSRFSGIHRESRKRILSEPSFADQPRKSYGGIETAQDDEQ